MKTFTITCTKDFREAYPELKRTDKFKRALDAIFTNGGYTFTLKVAGEGRHFPGKKNHRWNAIIRHDKRGRYMQRIWWQVGRWNTMPISWAMIATEIGQLIKDDFATLEPCSGCHGTGRKPHFSHIANGLCFDCMGMGHFYSLNETITK